jgi:hypothetical protein
MPDYFCTVIDTGNAGITLADDAGSFERIEFNFDTDEKRAMLAIGLVAMTSGRKVWLRVDAATEGSVVRSMSLA